MKYWLVIQFWQLQIIFQVYTLGGKKNYAAMFQGTATTLPSTRATRSIVRTPTDCLMGRSLPRTWRRNTTIWATAPSGSIMPGPKPRRLLITMLQFTEVSPRILLCRGWNL